MRLEEVESLIIHNERRVQMMSISKGWIDITALVKTNVRMILPIERDTLLQNGRIWLPDVLAVACLVAWDIS
jgi:hypothetical protein